MKIEIVTTPNDELKETGFGSIAACQSVLESIKKSGHSVNLNVSKTESDLHFIVNKQPDLVILAVKYLPVKNGRDIWLTDYFDHHHINFSGSKRETLEFDSDKVSAKLFLRNQGIKTARFFTAIPGQFTSKNDLPLDFPLFLKPVDAANGNGIDDQSLVNNFDEYALKLTTLYKTFNKPVLVEEYLKGQEYTVAIIKTQHTGFYTSIIEIIPPESSNGLRILGEKAKREDTETIRKAGDIQLINKIRDMALDVFKLLKVRDFARIDIKMNEFGECFFMEANLVPGLTSGSSYFPKAFLVSHGFHYDKVIDMLIDGGISRVPSRMTPMRDYCQNNAPPVLSLYRKSVSRFAQMFG